MAAGDFEGQPGGRGSIALGTRKSLLHFNRVSDQKGSSMAVIPFSASARHKLLSRTASSTSALTATDADLACCQALSARRLIADSALPLAGQAQESVLYLMS
ncbi:hypothetical protein ACQR16_13700 [Bradyrhizobium oligotrophicum]|uniref:hypothetical protein n=1 Tax=Bradyrhizobium oligotrophicum TaxID=44255 RepID=UPI003EB8106D